MQRARLWKDRAVSETKQSARTWFGTITIAPHHHNRFLNECRRKETASGINFDTLPLAERIGLIHMRIAIEITKYLKRVRKVSKAKLRYLLVMESVTNHQEGLPHYHILIHEVSGLGPVRHELLKSQWPYGFVHYKLVSSLREAAYVTKYLTKDTGARVRASVNYGKTSSDIVDLSTWQNLPPKLSPSLSEVEVGPVLQERF